MKQLVNLIEQLNNDNCLRSETDKSICVTVCDEGYFMGTQYIGRSIGETYRFLKELDINDWFLNNN